MRIVPWIFALTALPAIARTLEPDQLGKRHAISRSLPTLIVFAEPAHLALGSPLVELKPVMEGDGSKIWQIKPRCQKGCKKKQAELEFVLISGQTLKLRLRIVRRAHDHVLVVRQLPSQASLSTTRHRLLPKARQTFLRAVRGWPKFPPADVKVPAEIEPLAEHWEAFRSQGFLIYRGTPSHAQRKDIETLQTPTLVLAGFSDRSLIIVQRRGS